MNNNPFHTEPLGGNSYYNWQQLTTKPYNILSTPITDRLYGTMCQAIEHHSQYTLSVAYDNRDNDIRRRLAQIYRAELQQGIRLANLIPNDNSILVHAVDIVHLSILLTSQLANLENDKYAKRAMDYMLLEHCDNLYRLANLIDSNTPLDCTKLVGDLCEIIPMRPTISQHLHPHDTIKRFVNYKQCNSTTILHITLLQALSQYACNYYTTILPHYSSTLGRQLLSELAHISSQHYSMYSSLADTFTSPIDNVLISQYAECYCYYSAYNCTQQDIYQQHYDQELYHLHSTSSMLQHSTCRVWQQILGDGQFPESIQLQYDKQYIRQVLTSSINITSQLEDYCDSALLDNNSTQSYYQQQLNSNTRHVPSHCVIERHIADCGCDYRQCHTIHPIEQLQDRHHDNTTIGRTL